MTISKNIIDRPLQKDDTDKLSMDKYTKGLQNFIENSNTPMTISIQGEWGSGKTSLMNKLEHGLLQGEKFYTFRLNTWEYALVDQENVPAALFKDFITKIDNPQSSSAKQVIGSFLQIGARALVSNVSGGGVDIEGVLADYLAVPTLNDLKDDITKLIETKSGNGSKKLLFFVDDLDRLNPPDAIRILELLKNLFDQPHCIFVLAIDYDVVVKGLKSKFGDDKENEREYRQFFDKIIQLPFTMPVANYSLDKYLKKLLVNDISYIEGTFYDNNKEILEKVTIQTIGKNPRSLKRVINYLSLIKCIIEVSPDTKEKKQEDKIVQYILICIQIAYPQVYSFLTKHQNFKDEWDDGSYTVEMSQVKEDKFLFKDDDELFDDVWEKTLYVYVMSLKNKYLINRLHSISGVLNELINYIGKERANENFDAIMRDMLAMSSITDAQNDQLGTVADDKKEFWEEINKTINDTNIVFGKNSGKSSKLKSLEKNCIFNHIQVTIINDAVFKVKCEYSKKLRRGSIAWNTFCGLPKKYENDNYGVEINPNNDKELIFSSVNKTEFASLLKQLRQEKK